MLVTPLLFYGIGSIFCCISQVLSFLSFFINSKCEHTTSYSLGIVFLWGLRVSDMRKLGWLFPESKESSFTDLWTSIDLDAIDLSVILQQGETMASLAAFTVRTSSTQRPMNI